MSKSVFKIANDTVVCQLYHKNKHNNSIDVVCELSDDVGTPFLEQKHENGEEQWVVPNDIVGLNAKKAKNIKIRFHPSVVEMPSIHRFACQSALKFLDVLLEDSDWTKRTDQEDKLFDAQIDKLATFLFDMDKVIELEKNSLSLQFLFDDNFDDLLKLIQCNSIKSHLITKLHDDPDTQLQTIEILFEKECGTPRKLAKLIIDTGYLTSDAICDQPVNFHASKSCLTWLLPRYQEDFDISPPNVPQKLEFYMMVNGVEQEVAVYAPCVTVFHLLDTLSEAMKNGAGVACSAGSPAGHAALSRVSQSLQANVIIGLDKSEAPHLAKFIYTITSTPLMVNTDFDATTVSDTEAQLTWSPTDSIDSGISLSPTQTIDEPDFEFATATMMRARSRSECGGYSPFGSVKGILKWPRNNSRLMRSYSECHDDLGPISPSYFGDAVCQPFSEEEEDIFQESDSGSEIFSTPPMGRKKSVSFSERIEKRLFNSNTSITAQKLKNQKKNEKKNKKRENSLTSSMESIHEEAAKVSPRKNRLTV